MENKKQFWIIRVNDGENFRNSKFFFFFFWGGKARKRWMYNNCKKMNKGDILCFMTSKKYGGKIIGMSEYCEFYDRNDEPLIKINNLYNHYENFKFYAEPKIFN